MPFFPDQEPVSDTLFNDRSLSNLIEMQNGRAENIVAEFGSDALLATPTEDIVEQAYDICHLEVPVLRRTGYTRPIRARFHAKSGTTAGR